MKKKRASVFLGVISAIFLITAISFADGQKICVEDMMNNSNLGEYLDAFFLNALTEHYDVSDIEYHITNVSRNVESVSIQGYAEATMKNVYQDIDKLPFICGIKAAYGIESFNKLIKGNSNQLNNKTLSVLIDEILPESKDYALKYIEDALIYQFSGLQYEMGDFTASYFFNIETTSDLSDFREENSTILIEEYGVGYVDPLEIMPKKYDDLFAEGYDFAMQMIREIRNSDELMSSTRTIYYNRLDARDYALIYSGNPIESCHCGSITYDPSNADRPGVNYATWNNYLYPYYSIFCHDDCSDFASQAISVGGVPQTDQWKRDYYSTDPSGWVRNWTVAQDLNAYMSANSIWSQSTYAVCNAGNAIYLKTGHIGIITKNDTIQHLFSAHTYDRHNSIYGNIDIYRYYAINLN